jgi:hypothetical protein
MPCASVSAPPPLANVDERDQEAAPLLLMRHHAQKPRRGCAPCDWTMAALLSLCCLLMIVALAFVAYSLQQLAAKVDPVVTAITPALQHVDGLMDQVKGIARQTTPAVAAGAGFLNTTSTLFDRVTRLVEHPAVHITFGS